MLQLRALMNPFERLTNVVNGLFVGRAIGFRLFFATSSKSHPPSLGQKVIRLYGTSNILLVVCARHAPSVRSMTFASILIKTDDNNQGSF